MKLSKQEETQDKLVFLILIKRIWENLTLIVKIVGVFSILGLIISVLSPKEFTASSTFVPQVDNSKGGGKLGGLASIAGINLGGIGMSSDIPPSLYPRIVNSVKFKRALLEVSITIEKGNTKTTYQEFYENMHSPGLLSLVRKYTVGLPGLFLSSVSGHEEAIKMEQDEKSSSLLRLSQTEVRHFKRLRNQMQVIPNEKEGIVELNFVMPEPLMAAEMTKATEELLQKEVIDFKIRNAKEQLKFTEKQFEEKRIDFKQKQRELASFRDKNQNISSAVALNKLQTLEAEYNFAFNIYTEMAKQLEQSKLQVSKDTPIFSIINPVSIPTNKSAPNRFLIFFGFTFFGFVIALILVFTKNILVSLREEWNS